MKPKTRKELNNSKTPTVRRAKLVRSSIMRSFWKSKGVPVSISVIKGLHQRERQSDKSTRSAVAGDADGSTVSNLFSLSFDKHATVHRYTVDVAGFDKRQLRIRTNKILSMFSIKKQHNIRARASCGTPLSLSMPSAVVAVGDRIYSRHPIPEDLLSLRSELLDSGWKYCRLVREGEFSLRRLEDDALQPLVNRILPWSANTSASASDVETRATPAMSSVRERDGKIVCTTDSISVEGIRVFEGTTAHALYVNGPFVDAPSSIIGSNDLQHIVREGNLPHTIKFVVKMIEGTVNVRGRVVLTAIVGDASGDKILRIWDRPNMTLTVGKPYAATGLQAIANASGRLELAATTSSSIQPVHATDGTLPNKHSLISPVHEGYTAPRLMLRLDTKCTVASECSLWEEIVHHFGPPPYSRDVQRQINQAAEAMPVVTSTSLRHGVVKILNFTADSLNAVPLNADVRKIQPMLDQHQPLAILDDYTIWPLQTLHCCFDPHMRAWQDIAVSACSFFPRRRVEILNRFRESLTAGLSEWGITASPYACTTSDVSVLSSPRPKPQAYTSQNNYRSNIAQPSHRIFIGVPGARATSQQREMCWGTATHVSQGFQGSHVITAEKEVDAMGQLETLLQSLSAGRDARAIDFQPVVVIFTTDRDSRACRWMLAESLRQGCIPISMPAVKANKVKLLAANCKLQMTNKLRLDPIGDRLDISGNVPSLRGKNILCVGIDTCHVASSTIGAMTGIMLLDHSVRKHNSTPFGASMLSNFWRVDVRGQELEQVSDNFRDVVARAEASVGKGNLHEIVVLQDGSVFSELQSMRRSVPAGCGLTFTCLHKRTNIRFHHEGHGNLIANNVRGTVIQALTPSARHSSSVAPSFYIQSHDSAMSTARTLQVTLHCSSDGLPNQDLQQLLFLLSHAASFVPTKLPLPTRCAHKLASKVERLMDADPSFNFDQLKESLRYRLWFL